ncbi:MAG: RHS repeat-associated core domain-containing protein [Bacteroidales bacterium]|nr:RHS repeat-associated core domain-containing protein [Bacteroidales bacterium]
MKPFISTIIFILLFITGFSQDPQPYFELNEPISPHETQGDFVASEYIRMSPAFWAHPYDDYYQVSARIDPLLVFPPEDGDETGGAPNNDLGGVVGTLPGNLMVSPTGAAVYNIPIEVPPGVAGMTPQLGLTYNSQGGNGLLGIGWSLTGLSAITRTGTTIYNDGYIDGVDVDGNDKLMLDGQRLIPINPESTEFRTENESFSRILVKESITNGYKYFEVWTKDGRILEYGNTIESRLKFQEKDAVLMWELNQVRDRSGNFIDYTYSSAVGGMNYIENISYGGNINTRQNSFYKIDFLYTSERSDPNSFWIVGSEIDQTLLLSNIKISYQNEQNTVSSYDLLYDNGFYTHMKSVKLSNNKGNTYNPTLFEWGTNETISVVNSTNLVNGDYKADYTLGDFNGDGRTDIVRAFYTLNGDEKVFHHYSVSYCQEDGVTFNEIYCASIEYTYDTRKFHHFVAGDFNGDGIDDLIEIRIHETQENIEFAPFLILKADAGFEYSYQSYSSIIFDKASSGYFLSCDLNGNGVSELLTVKNNKIGDNKHIMGLRANEYDNDTELLTSLFTNYPATDGYTWVHYNNDMNPISVGDFDGDGRSDLLVNDQLNRSSIFRLDGNNNQLETTIGIRGPFIPCQGQIIKVGDFNGDGLSDILTCNDDYSNYQIHYFDGSGSFIQGECPMLTDDDETSFQNEKTILKDFNGDGKTDILQNHDLWELRYHEYEQTYWWEYVETDYYIHYSNGLGFYTEITTLNQYSPFDSELFHPRSDFSGDNNEECLLINGSTHKILSFHQNEQKHFIKKFTNGLGHVTNLTYTPLTDNTIYTKGTGEVYPLVDIQPALNVVTNVEADNGIGGQSTTNYLYAGAKIHKEGKGFLGFEKLTILSNPNTDKSTKIVNSFSLNKTYYFNWLENSSSYVYPNFNDPISETINQAPEVKLFGPDEDKRIFYYTPLSLTKVHSTGDAGSSYVSTTLTKQEYSTTDILYGNLTSTTVFTEPEEVGFTCPEQAFDFYTKTDFTYDIDEPNWLIDRIKTAQTSTWDKTDATIDKQKNTFTYYPDSPLVRAKLQVPNNSTPLITVVNYEYDDYGNLTQSALYAPNFSPSPANRITDYSYDGNYQHRFVTETKNTLNGTDYITSSTYDPATGLPVTSTDLSGLITAYEYDGFGRLQQTTYPDGVVDKSRLYWVTENPDNPDYALFYIWSQRSGEQEVLSFADQMGRNLLTVSKDAKDRKVYTETKYNNMGQVAQSSNPHYSTSDLLWTTYEYLTTGAVKKVISPTATIEYTYNGRITTTTNTTLGIQTSKEANAIGQVVKATDPGGSIDYTYYSSGLPKSITAGGATTLLYYDDAGYQEKLIEPDAGTILYDYNPFGELISQTNTNLHTYTMTYDGLGRITNKTLEGSLDDITTYTYCPVGTHGFGQLQTVSGSNGIQTSYTYDNFSRVIEKSQLIDGKKYDFTYDYNVYGKARNVTWPTGFSIKYRYKKGYLSAVEENSTGNKLWDLADINARGQVTQYQLGNGLLTTKGYDDYGFPTTIYTDRGVQDLEYDFNTNSGNLNWRQATVSGQTLKENFTYDVLGLNNRLTTWKVGTGTQYSVDYSDDGNMNTKTGVGTYLYGTGNDGPHAVSRIKDPDAAYLAMAKINKQELTYTGFDKTATIRQYNPANQEQASVLEITYGPGQSRKLTKLYQAGDLVKTKTFIDGTFEIEEDANGNLRQLHYLSGGDGLFAIYVIDQAGKASMNYIHKDYQGSFETITNHKGEVVERLSFDPWGRRRNATDWTFNNVSETYTFDRGYTGHEHLEVFGLINMNGRMYDPMLGRFLSPDNFVQSPDYTQNFNRYSYVMNNPLKYTDPSGEWIHIVIGAAIGGILNWATHGAQFNAAGLGYFGVGALAGAMAAGIGAGIGTLAAGSGSFGFGVSAGLSASGFGAGAAVGAAAGLTSGFLSGTGNSLIAGNNIGQSLNAGLKEGAKQGIIGGVMGGIGGGIRASRNGGNFWTGRSKLVPVENNRSMLNGNVSYRSKISSYGNLPEKSYTTSGIPPLTADGSQACTETVISAADRSLGGNLTPADIRNLTAPGSDPNTTPLFTENAFNSYSANTHNPSGYFANGDGKLSYALQQMTQNEARVSLKYQLIGGDYHMVNLVTVSRSIGNGYQYTLMNPSNGTFNTVSSIDFTDFFYFIYP